METLNCMRCKYRHEDNGNCTAVGGFCTAVTAAHCPLLREYLDTGLTPGQVVNAKNIIELAFADDTSKAERIRKLMAADDEGRVVALPCKVGDMLYEVTGRKTISVYKVKAIRVELFSLFIEWDIVEGFVWQYLNGINANEIGKTVFLSREEAEEALQEMEGKKDG